MAINPIKGEVELALADGRKFTLVNDFQSRVAAEDAYGKPYRLVLQDAGEERLGAIRALFYGMLSRHHPKITLEEVGELIDTSGDEIMDAANRAMGAAAPEIEDTEDKEEKNPPKRQRGRSSGGNGAKSA